MRIDTKLLSTQFSVAAHFHFTRVIQEYWGVGEENKERVEWSTIKNRTRQNYIYVPGIVVDLLRSCYIYIVEFWYI